MIILWPLQGKARERKREKCENKIKWQTKAKHSGIIVVKCLKWTSDKLAFLREKKVFSKIIRFSCFMSPERAFIA